MSSAPTVAASRSLPLAKLGGELQRGAEGVGRRGK